MMNLEDARTRSLTSKLEVSKIRSIIIDTHLAVKDGEQKYEDLLSHWVLSLAFAQTEELRRRYVLFETELFKYRFMQLSTQEIRRFLSEEGLNYEVATDSERDEMVQEYADYDRSNPLEDVFILTSTAPKEAALLFNKTFFYKIPFTEVCDLVRSRRVFIKKGIAYVPQRDLLSALSTRFATELTAKLETAARSLIWAAKDERMGPLISKLQTASIGTDMSNMSVTSKLGAVRLDDLPALAKRSFPMCARVLDTAMTKEHHLKYDSRVQYSLFLKGIGLTMDDCVAYFQREFCKRPMSADEFRKKGYLYGVMYSYGQKGKQKDFMPWSCSKALSKRQTAPDQRHGCPFQEFSPDKLGQVAKETGVSETQARAIVERVKNHEYQVACRLHWEALHPGGNAESVGNHPNAWFDASMKFHEEKDKADKASATSNPIASSSSSQQSTTVTEDVKMTQVSQVSMVSAE